jgi:hypothetical protein
VKREVLVGGPGTSCKLAAAGRPRECGHVKYPTGVEFLSSVMF